MTRVRIPLLFLTLLAIAEALAQPGTEPKDETFSRNKKFSAEISAARIDRPLLSLFSHTGDNSTHLWSRSLVPEGEDPQEFSSGWDLNAYRKIVSDDGTFVILRQRNFRPDMPVLRLFTRKVEKSFDADAILEVLDGSVENEYSAVQPGFLELTLQAETPRLFALWHPISTQWIVLNVDTLALQKPDAAQIKHLNELGLLEAREIARRHRPGSLRRALNTVRERAASVIPNLVQPADDQDQDESSYEPAYRFLAWMKQPEDRALIEALLDSDLNVTAWSGGGFSFPGRAGEASTQLRSAERALADRLLDQWDGKKSPLTEDADDGLYGPEKHTRFSAVIGKLHLPFEAPPDAGSVFILLIPAKVGIGQWQHDDSVIRLSYLGAQNMRFPGQHPGPGPSTIKFTFDTIPPSDYRLKAFWDRRPATTPHRLQKAVLPEAGDYESGESSVLTLVASQPVAGIDIFCTNRVGQMEQFAAEDENWAKEHPSEEPDVTSLPAPMRGQKRTLLIKAPVSDWVLRTNQNQAKLGLVGISLSEYQTDTGGRQRQFSIRITIPGIARNQRMLPNLKAELLDEHGCRFETRGFNNSGRIFALDFPAFPFGSKQISMVISREDYEDEKGRSYQNGARTTELANYTLTNLFHTTPEDWKPDTFPARRDLDIVSVELATFNPEAPEFQLHSQDGVESYGFPGMGRPSRPVQNKFLFSASGKAAAGWRKYSGKFADRWGNESYSLREFCQEEEVIKYVVEIARDPLKASFRDDEKFEIPLEKIPGAGENVKLDTRKTLQGIPFRVFSVSGTGEFTYEEGKLLSAKEEPEDDDSVPLFGAPGRTVVPKLRIRPVRQPGMPTGFPGTSVGPVTIISKIPHVVCRVAPAPPGTLFALLEQDPSIPEPGSDRRSGLMGRYFPQENPDSVKYWALDYRPGETNKKLTFISQKTRKAEFFVKLPKAR